MLKEQHSTPQQQKPFPESLPQRRANPFELGQTPLSPLPQLPGLTTNEFGHWCVSLAHLTPSWPLRRGLEAEKLVQDILRMSQPSRLEIKFGYPTHEWRHFFADSNG